MEREEQESSGESPQAAEEEQSQISEKKRVIIAMTRILGSGTLDEESLRLLEQLADCIQRPQTGVTREAEPVKQAAAQQVTPARGEPVETEVERVVAAREARERETSASGQLTAPEVAGRRETKEPCPTETAESMGAREINVPEKETAAARRDGEPLAGAAMKQRQEEAAADRHQAAAGEQPPSSMREGIGPVPLSATDPGHKMQDAVGLDRPQLTAAKADRIETSRKSHL